VLSSNHIVFRYPGSKELIFPDISLSDHEHCLILGRSGSGKTTLLHILAGLLKPASGMVHLDGQNIFALSAAALDHFRGQKIGIIFQQSFFIHAVSLTENLFWTQRLAGKQTDPQRIQDLLKRLNIDHHKDHLPSRLSIGEQQRASIARALVNKPSIILADEPTSALDDTNAEQVIRLLKEQAAQEGSSLIIVTHDARVKSHFDHHIILQA
jgi:putative ABC transport system ATP-binding protein